MTTFRCKPFHELNAQQLYSIMALRQQVFVVEQNCVYLDADGLDIPAWHLMGYDTGGKLAAYARLMPKGVVYKNHASLGRVVTAASVRRTGVGKELMQEALNWMGRLFPDDTIKIGAQKYLRNFYESLGFVVSGAEYMEDGIPHFPMVR